MKITVKRTAWAAIRKTEGRYWIDKDTISYLIEMTQKAADDDDKELPHWALSNPVVSIQQIEMYTEVDTLKCKTAK